MSGYGSDSFLGFLGENGKIYRYDQTHRRKSMKPWKPTITQLDCIKASAKQHGWTIEETLTHRVCLPCACDEEGCRGWAIVLPDDLSILDHNTLFAPTTETK